MKMHQQPHKLLKFVAAILLALPNSLALLEKPLDGCYRDPIPEPCERISLEPFQMNQINDARDFIDELRANKTKTYLNQEPIVKRFTQDQMARIMCAYQGFGGNRPVDQDLLWEEAANTSTTNTATPSPEVPERPSRKRRNTAGTLGLRICPANNIVQTLITAFNADDEPLQIVQFTGFQQWVLRQRCKESMSLYDGQLGETTFNIDCQTIQRSVYLVAIRLDDDFDTADINVREVQVESCSSFMGE